MHDIACERLTALRKKRVGHLRPSDRAMGMHGGQAGPANEHGDQKLREGEVAPTGQLLHFITRNRILQYPEELPGFQLPESYNTALNEPPHEKSPVRHDPTRKDRLERYQRWKSRTITCPSSSKESQLVVYDQRFDSYCQTF